MPEPALDLHQVEAGAEPVGSRSFPEPVKVMLLAYGASLARHFDFMAVIVSTLADRNLTLAAIQPRTLCDRFEFAEEMTSRFPIFVCERPAVGNRVLLVLGQE